MSTQRTIDDWRGLYVLVDPEHCRGSVLEFAEAVLRGGCSILQLRAKTLSDREALALARALRVRTREHGVHFVVNDRIDLALLSEADGVHLGQDDLPLAEARRLAPELVVGVSTHDIEQAKRADRAGADIVAFGPIFTTHSKKNPDPVTGLDTLAQVAGQTDRPVVAIGGIDATTIGAVGSAGARMAAVISAIANSEDVEGETRRLRKQFEAGGQS